MAKFFESMAWYMAGFATMFLYAQWKTHQREDVSPVSGYVNYDRAVVSGDLHQATSSGPGFRMQWGRVRDVDSEVSMLLDACQSRLSHLQSTSLGSDTKARALFAIMQALDHLNGTNEVTSGDMGSSAPEGE
jgi:hypothetical protein